MSRARILADYVSSGDELADKAPLASPAFTGTPTGITAAHLEAGVLPSDVTGGSGLTALGTVTTGTLGGTSIISTSGAITTTGKLAYSEIYNDLGYNQYSGSGQKRIYGTSWTDVLQLDFNNASWGSVAVHVFRAVQYAATQIQDTVFKAASHAANASVSIDTYHSASTSTSYYQWANISNGLHKLQMKTDSSVENNSVVINWSTSSRNNDPILVTFL